MAAKAGILGLSMTSRRRKMSQFTGSTRAAIDYNSTIIGALELSEKKWVRAGSGTVPRRRFRR